MQIVDSQVHIAETGKSTWTVGSMGQRAHALPGAPALLNEMKMAGVDAVVLVPPLDEQDEPDNSWCLEAARAHPDRFVVMGRFRPERRDGPRLLDGWLEQPGMKGIRLSFTARRGNLRLLQDGSLDWFWERASADNIPLMINLGGHADLLLPVVRRFPRLRIAVDHLGLAARVDPAEFPRALAPVLKLAAHANIAVKASALPAYVNEAFPFPSLREPLRQIIDAFGAERVFWGSDMSRLTCTYPQLVDFFRNHLTFLTERQRDLVLGEGLLRWLSWQRKGE